VLAAVVCRTVWVMLLMPERLVQQVDMTPGFERRAFPETAECEYHHTEVDHLSRYATCCPDE